MLNQSTEANKNSADMLHPVRSEALQRGRTRKNLNSKCQLHLLTFKIWDYGSEKTYTLQRRAEAGLTFKSQLCLRIGNGSAHSFRAASVWKFTSRLDDLEKNKHADGWLLSWKLVMYVGCVRPTGDGIRLKVSGLLSYLDWSSDDQWPWDWEIVGSNPGRVTPKH